MNVQDSLHIVTVRPEKTNGYFGGYYAPMNREQYQEGIVNYRLTSPPGWGLLHTLRREFENPFSKINETLNVMTLIEGDGLQAYQRAALSAILPEEARACFKALYDEKLLGLTPGGVIVEHGITDFSYWMGWERLLLCGLVESTGERLTDRDGFKRVGYRFTGKGWLIARLADKVKLWEASV